MRLPWFERWIESTGLTVARLLTSDSRWMKVLGGAIAIPLLLSLWLLLQVWILFGKKPHTERD